MKARARLYFTKYPADLIVATLGKVYAGGERVVS